MSSSFTQVVTARIPRTHSHALEVAGRLSDEQLTWRANLHAPSIGFHVWHIARWADRLQARLPGMAPELLQQLGPGQEIWESEHVAQHWGLAAEGLGFGGTGMEMGDEMSASLVLPGKANLLDYAQRAFSAADGRVSLVEDRHFPKLCIGLYDRETTIGQVLLTHLVHASRHLGMIEALCGVQGVQGTATL